MSDNQIFCRTISELVPFLQKIKLNHGEKLFS